MLDESKGRRGYYSCKIQRLRFFVPKQGVEGKEVIINGDLSIDTLSVPQLRHYAEDAGKTSREINNINDPEITLSFIATGVIIRE